MIALNGEAMSITSIASLTGILGLILTLLFMARQTRKLTEQTLTGNAIAHLDAHYNALERFHDLNRFLLDKPNLQPYFLLGKNCQVGDPEYNTVRLLAEMFADVFDLGLELHRRIKDDIHTECWNATVVEALKQPVLRQVITSDAPWWPDLRLFAKQRPELCEPPPSSDLAVNKSSNLDSSKAAKSETPTEFNVLEGLAHVAAPGQAVIDAWGLLEYQPNVMSDWLAPGQPHGWPQVTRNLDTWDKWSMLYPAVVELRRLRDYTVRSNRPPSSSDAARYVSVAHDLVITLRTSLAFPPSYDSDGGERAGKRAEPNGGRTGGLPAEVHKM
jgi:hypothetical protein